MAFGDDKRAKESNILISPALAEKVEKNVLKMAIATVKW